MRIGRKVKPYIVEAAMKAKTEIDAIYRTNIYVRPAAGWDDPIEIVLIRCCYEHHLSAYAFSDLLAAHVFRDAGKKPTKDERPFGSLRTLEWERDRWSKVKHAVKVLLRG